MLGAAGIFITPRPDDCLGQAGERPRLARHAAAAALRSRRPPKLRMSMPPVTWLDDITRSWGTGAGGPALAAAEGVGAAGALTSATPDSIELTRPRVALQSVALPPTPSAGRARCWLAPRISGSLRSALALMRSRVSSSLSVTSGTSGASAAVTGAGSSSPSRSSRSVPAAARRGAGVGVGPRVLYGRGSRCWVCPGQGRWYRPCSPSAAAGATQRAARLRRARAPGAPRSGVTQALPGSAPGPRRRAPAGTSLRICIFQVLTGRRPC
ncbi:MAG: hypothetical protein J3K34DRAFT_441390 [Monoraphidium minutum]|nr:MAG: hypothetical protein J3K34DRAFT_441390 [Monoraphidium minutum]